MQTRVLFAALISVGLSVASEGRADSTSWLNVVAPKSCDVVASELAERVGRSIVGERGAEVRASVVIEEVGFGVQITLLTHGDARSPGKKVLSAPTCEEAVEAAVLVLALALGEPATGPLGEEVSTGSLSAEPAAGEADKRAEPALLAPVEAPHVFSMNRARVEPRRDQAMTNDVPASADGFRLSIATGVDSGMSHALSPYGALGFAQAFAVFELRGVLRYGLPLTEVSDEVGQRERVQREFGALELAACRGFGTRWHLATCAGGEAGVVYTKRELHTAGGVDLDEDAGKLRLAATLGLIVAHRASVIQPEFELSSTAVALGRSADSPWLALRVAVGAATHF